MPALLQPHFDETLWSRPSLRTISPCIPLHVRLAFSRPSSKGSYSSTILPQCAGSVRLAPHSRASPGAESPKDSLGCLGDPTVGSKTVLASAPKRSKRSWQGMAAGRTGCGTGRQGKPRHLSLSGSGVARNAGLGVAGREGVRTAAKRCAQASPVNGCVACASAAAEDPGQKLMRSSAALSRLAHST